MIERLLYYDNEGYDKEIYFRYPPSGIRKYFDLVNEMEDVISLGIGEPDFETPWTIREEGIYSLEKGRTHYSSNAGFIELREEIARYMKNRFSLEYCPKDEILVTVGGSEAIDIAVRTFAGPGMRLLSQSRLL